ncbi:MAG: tRNA (N6-threonylcarbamoyladenosine(37)-N6)-methyltransferase TrmO [Halanaeroarchaeum sp.]
MIELEPIGTVHTPIETTEDAPRQGMLDDIEGTIELEAAYAAGLDGYEPGEEILVVWFADRADRSLLRVDKRGNRGVFRSRSPARPNPIVLTTVEIVAIEGPRLTVRGVDMLDGSPVLDLKVPLGPA